MTFFLAMQCLVSICASYLEIVLLGTCEFVEAADITAMRSLKKTGILDPIVGY